MVAKEYAKALHEIAEELNIFDIIKNQYKITLDLLKDQQMMSFFTNPVIKSNEKKDLIKKSFSDFNEIFVYFLYYFNLASSASFSASYPGFPRRANIFFL